MSWHSRKPGQRMQLPWRTPREARSHGSKQWQLPSCLSHCGNAPGSETTGVAEESLFTRTVPGVKSSISSVWKLFRKHQTQHAPAFLPCQRVGWLKVAHGSSRRLAFVLVLLWLNVFMTWLRSLQLLHWHGTAQLGVKECPNNRKTPIVRIGTCG